MITLTKPVVIVVGSDKGGVGKTTVSRTMLDYFTSKEVPIRSFDTESPRGTLKRFHSASEIVDLTSITGQMRIFDTLTAGSPSVTLIDVRAGVLSTALQALKNVGFLEAAKNGEIIFAVFHVLGSSIASLDEIIETSKFMDGAKYFLVKNHISNNTFFEWDQATYDAYFKQIPGTVELTIPQLDSMAFESVEKAAVPFLKFVANKDAFDASANHSFVLRGCVRHWLAAVWSEYERVELMRMVGVK